MNYLLISHGSYAKATLTSCEMITGTLRNVKAVEFKQTMNQQDLLHSIENTVSKFNNLDKLVLICDIKGGTPFNTALLFKKQHPDIKIISGLSLGLLLPIATGTSLDDSIKQVAQNISFFTEAKSIKKKVNDDPDWDIHQKLTPHTIKNVRIDERLIHGQVATMWTNKIGADRIMVVGDDIVKSSIQKTALKTAVPGGVHLSILTIDGAAKRINSGKYNGQNVFLIVRNPHILVELSKLNVKLPEINVGNMSSKSNSKQIAKSVAVTNDDIKEFNYLDQHGSHLYHQMVPADDPEDFMKLISNVIRGE